MPHTLKEINDILIELKKENEKKVPFIVKVDESKVLFNILESYVAAKTEKEKEPFYRLAKDLLAQGANPNIRSVDNYILLLRAIREKAEPFLELLIKSNKIHYNEKFKIQTFYQILVKTYIEEFPEKIDVIKYLAEIPNQTEFQDMLLQALNANDLKRVQYLFDNKLVDFNKPNSQGLLALHLLCCMDRTNLEKVMIEIFKKNKIPLDLKSTDKNGNTALHIVCHKRITSMTDHAHVIAIVGWLLKHGIDPNSKNNAGDTVLHIAVENSKFTSLIELLIKHKANPSLRDAKGFTPLMKIEFRPGIQHEPSCLNLLSSHASPSALASEPIDPIQLAYQKGLWFRMIGAGSCREGTIEDAIVREASILTNREKLDDRKLFINYPGFNKIAHPELLYSSSTLFVAGLPIKPFVPGNLLSFGVVIQKRRVIPAWAVSIEREIHTDSENSHVDYSSNRVKFRTDKIEKRYCCDEKSTHEILLQLQNLAEEHFVNCYPSPLKRYDAISNELFTIDYNEGLYRYKKSEIVAFIFVPTDENAYLCLKLQKALGLTHLPFITYDIMKGIENIPLEQVLARSRNHLLVVEQKNSQKSKYSTSEYPSHSQFFQPSISPREDTQPSAASAAMPEPKEVNETNNLQRSRK